MAVEKTILVHGAWSVAVVLAFVVGKSMTGGGGVEEAVYGEGSRVEISVSGAGRAVKAGERVGADGEGDAVDLIVRRGGKLSSADIVELGQRFKAELDPIKRRLAFARLLEGLTVENAKQIREQIEHLDDDSPEFREFHYAWGAIGGEESVLNGADTRKQDMAATLAGWASTDADAALAWFGGLPEGKYDQNGFSYALVHGLSNGDPDRAAAYVLGLAEAGDKRAEGMLGIVTGKMMQSLGASNAARWAEGLPEGNMRSSAMGRVADRLFHEDKDAAIEWAATFGGSEDGKRVVEAVGREWSERDPAGAVGWLESLADGSGKTSGYRTAMREWAGRDPKAASEYLVAMPQSGDRDHAIGGFVGRLAWEDPVSAIQWAGEIGDGGHREEVLMQAGQAYYRKSPEAAVEWLVGSGLSEAAQAKVLEPPRRRGR